MTPSSDVEPVDDASRKRKRRQRPIISCTECHRRKQKVSIESLSGVPLYLKRSLTAESQCDRQEPCGNCTLRSASHLCTYETGSTVAASNRPRKPASASPKLSPEENTAREVEVEGGVYTEIGNSYGYASGVKSNTAVEVLEKV